MTQPTEPRPLVSFFVPGEAQPRGSKTIQVRYGRDGKPVINAEGRVETWMRDDNPESTKWMQMVYKACKAACREAGMLEPSDCPLVLRLTVHTLRPKGHFGKAGNLLPSAPLYPAVMPDLTKLVRGIEDAMQKLAMTNDSRIVTQINDKRYSDREGAEIELFTLPKNRKEQESWNRQPEKTLF